MIYTKVCRGTCVVPKSEVMPEYVSLGLGRSLIQGVYNGVTEEMASLLHGQYDVADVPSVDPVNTFSSYHEGALVADKFDRAMVVASEHKSDVVLTSSTIPSVVPEVPPTSTTQPIE